MNGGEFMDIEFTGLFGHSVDEAPPARALDIGHKADFNAAILEKELYRDTSILLGQFSDNGFNLLGVCAAYHGGACWIKG